MKENRKFLVFVIGLLLLNIKSGYAQTYTTGDCNWTPVSMTGKPLKVSDTWASVSVQFRDKNGNISLTPPAPCNQIHAVRATIYWTKDTNDWKKVTVDSWRYKGNDFLFNTSGKNYKTIYPCSMPSFDFVIGDGGSNGDQPTENLTINTTYYYKVYFYQWQGDGTRSNLICLCPSPTYSFKTREKPIPTNYELQNREQYFCGENKPSEISGKEENNNYSYSWAKSTDGGKDWKTINGATSDKYTPPLDDFDTKASSPVTINYKRLVKSGNETVDDVASVTYFPASYSFKSNLRYQVSDGMMYITPMTDLKVSGATVQWEQSTSFNGTYENVSTGVNGAVLSISASDNNYYRATISYGDCASSTSEVICPSQASAIKGVTTGGQTWMAEDLKVSKFNDGTDITAVDISSWSSNTSTPSYTNPGTGCSNGAYLYNPQVVASDKNVCPVGWRIPTYSEFSMLASNSANFRAVFINTSSPNIVTGYISNNNDLKSSSCYNQTGNGNWWDASLYQWYTSSGNTSTVATTSNQYLYTKGSVAGIAIRCIRK